MKEETRNEADVYAMDRCHDGGRPVRLDTGARAKRGGVLREYMIDSPASMSIHEESTVVAERPIMGVFNNLVIFDQHVSQNELEFACPQRARRLG